jgi:hypothetical protein
MCVGCGSQEWNIILNIELIGMRPNPQGERTRTDLPAAAALADTQLEDLSAATLEIPPRQVSHQSSAQVNPNQLRPYWAQRTD